MKRTTSLLMAICMVFALMVNASAFELSAEDTVKPADPIQQMVDEKMAVILPQLAAQDALYLADDYEAILYAMFSAEYDENSISPLEDGTVNNVYAPRGGSVAYKQAREWGAVPGRFVVVGCTAEQGERWINEIETQRDVARAIMEAVNTLNWLPPYITGSASLRRRDPGSVDSVPCSYPRTRNQSKVVFHHIAQIFHRDLILIRDTALTYDLPVTQRTAASLIP